MATTEKQQRIFKARVSVALQRRLGRRPTDDELTSYTQVLLQAISGFTLLPPQQVRTAVNCHNYLPGIHRSDGGKPELKPRKCPQQRCWGLNGSAYGIRTRGLRLERAMS